MHTDVVVKLLSSRQVTLLDEQWEITNSINMVTPYISYSCYVDIFCLSSGEGFTKNFAPGLGVIKTKILSVNS